MGYFNGIFTSGTGVTGTLTSSIARNDLRKAHFAMKIAPRPTSGS